MFKPKIIISDELNKTNKAPFLCSVLLFAVSIISIIVVFSLDFFFIWGKVIFCSISVLSAIIFIFLACFEKESGRRYWLVFGISVALLIIAFLLGFFCGRSVEERNYQKMIKAFDAKDENSLQEIFEKERIFDYKDSVKYYEKAFLGNTNNQILQDGKILQCDEYILDATDGHLVKRTSLGESALTDYPVSFINIWNGVYIYRNDVTKNIIFNSGESIRSPLSVKVGELLVDNDILYYINLDDGSKIYAYNLNTGMNLKILNESVEYFVIYGNNLVVLSRNHDFKIYDKSKREMKASFNNVESFCFDERLFLSDGKNIVSFSPNLKDVQAVAQKEGELIAAYSKGAVLLSDDSMIYVDNTGADILLASNIDICRSFLMYENKIEILYYVKENNTFVEKNITIDANALFGN